MEKKPGPKQSVEFTGLTQRREKDGSETLYAIFRQASAKNAFALLSEKQIRDFLSAKEPMPFLITDYQLIKGLGAIKRAQAPELK